MDEVPRKRILLVDDAPELRDLGRLALERFEGWEVLPAASGEEALDVAGRERPDAILMDYMMPGMNGLEAARALKGQPDTADIPIVLFSGRADLNPGPEVVGVLQKPADPLSLGRQVRAVLGWT